MWPSSGETTVFMWHLVLVVLYGWLSGMQVGMKYSCFSWWWAYSRSKHVEKRNKHQHHHHHHHLPPWIRSFDLFRHRRIAIVSWGVHCLFFLEVCSWGRVSGVWCCPFFQGGWCSFVCIWLSRLVFQRSLVLSLWLRFLFYPVLCIPKHFLESASLQLLFTRLYRDARSTKRKIFDIHLYHKSSTLVVPIVHGPSHICRPLGDACTISWLHWHSVLVNNYLQRAASFLRS